MGYLGKKPAQTTIPVDDSVTTTMLQDDAVTSDNRHYQAILEWVAEGNTIEEPDS